MVNMSDSNHSTPRSNMIAGLTCQQIPSSTAALTSTSHSSIDDFREIIREQSFIMPNHSMSDRTDHIDVPVKRYPPLPDIVVPTTGMNSMSFFRTETVLSQPVQTQAMKQTFHHFARNSRPYLPALNKTHMPSSMMNVMDLDENLPECFTRIPHRVETYTSPNDRINSPIKRPSAPSPPASAQTKRLVERAFAHSASDQHHDNDDDDDDDNEIEDESRFSDIESQLFDNQYFSYRSHQTDRYSNSNSQHHHSRQQQLQRSNVYDDPASLSNELDLHR
jgi:hypothetical protein